jgi:hypothetical protein
MSNTPDMSAAVEYARRLYDDVRAWYANADGKAQVVLAIDGALVAFFAGAMFTKPADLESIVASFHSLTWPLLVLTAACLVGSIMAAILCLRSRTYSKRELQQFIDSANDVRSAECPVTTMWFFQFVAHHDKKAFLKTLQSVDSAFEIESMASQIHILSTNVRAKHRLANAGFVLAASTLILFFLAGVTYLARNAL